MYLYNNNFIVTYILVEHQKNSKCVLEQKILTVDNIHCNGLSKNVFSLS